MLLARAALRLAFRLSTKMDRRLSNKWRKRRDVFFGRMIAKHITSRKQFSGDGNPLSKDWWMGEIERAGFVSAYGLDAYHNLPPKFTPPAWMQVSWRLY